MTHLRTEPPAPSPETVTASRSHLTSRYALGVDKLLWEVEKRPMPDADAIRAVVSVAAAEGQAAGQVDALDMAAALVIAQAMRLELDVLEADVLDAARDSGVTAEAVAAILELPDAGSATARHDMLRARRELPQPPSRTAPQVPPPDPAGAGARAGARAARAATRAAQAARRREELHQAQASQQPAGDRQEHAERAAAHTAEARISARDSAERVALGLLRAAENLERCAARCHDWEDAASAEGTQDELRTRAAQYLKAAQSYRDMADRYRDIGHQLP